MKSSLPISKSVLNNLHKYDAAGNLFFLLEDKEESFLPSCHSLIPKVCANEVDGLLLLQPSAIADVKMRIFNRDGSEASMCGNGTRCVAAHLFSPCTIETKGGICHAKHLGGHTYLTTLPKTAIKKPPLSLIEGRTGYLVDTGTPHLVIFLESLSDEVLAPFIAAYADGTVNLNLAKREGEKIFVRTFEKGVGETASCGTGGGATTIAARDLFPLPPKICISYPKVSLHYTFDERGSLWMEGEAKLVEVVS